jgi:hypothetical protein
MIYGGVVHPRAKSPRYEISCFGEAKVVEDEYKCILDVSPVPSHSSIWEFRFIFVS